MFFTQHQKINALPLLNTALGLVSVTLVTITEVMQRRGRPLHVR